MTDQTEAPETFEYEVGGKTLSMPLLRGPRMTMGIARKTRGKDASDAASIIAEEWLSPEQLDLFDAIPQSEFGDFMKGWRKASGISVGESKASSNS